MWAISSRAAGDARAYAPPATALAVALLGLVTLLVYGSILGMALADFLVVVALFFLESNVAPGGASA